MISIVWSIADTYRLPIPALLDSYHSVLELNSAKAAGLNRTEKSIFQSVQCLAPSIIPEHSAIGIGIRLFDSTIQLSLELVGEGRDSISRDMPSHMSPISSI